MKKIAKYFFAALAMTAAVSCAKELMGDVRPEPVKGKSYVFTATMADTKAILDENTMETLWLGDEAGNEYITVMEPGSVNTYVAKGIDEPTVSADFVLEEGNGIVGNSVFAVYPRGEWDCVANSDTLGVKVVYATAQQAMPGTFDPKAPVAVAYNDDVAASQELYFHNVSALLKLQLLSNTDPVTDITVYSLAGEALSGAIQLLDVNGEPALIATEAIDHVSISNEDGSALETEVPYYLAVAPATLSKGIAIQFNGNETQTFTITKEIKIERNRIYDLGEFAYVAPEDDTWYVVGNFRVGNINSVKKTAFELVNDSYYVAKNVAIAEGQAFKFYNPNKGQVLHVASEKPIEAEVWNYLTSGNTYSYAAAGTYDIYIDKDFVGVALAAAGTKIPAYPTPEDAQYVWFYDDEVEWGGIPYHKVFDFGYTESGAIHVGINYDEYAINPETGDYADWYDWRMVGKWQSQERYDGYTVVAENMTRGEIRIKAEVMNPWFGTTSTQYFLIKYSNYDGDSVELYSPSQIMDEEGNYLPVLDEAGNPVYDDEGFPLTWNGTGLCEFDEHYNTFPIEMELSAEGLVVEEAPTDLPVPSGQFVWYAEDFNATRVFDLGATSEGDLFVATNYDELATDYETGAYASWADPRMVGTWKIDETYLSYEIEPLAPSYGQIKVKAEINHMIWGPMTTYFLFKYSNYNGKSLDILSPSTPVDEYTGEPIPVLDENYDPVLDSEGFPCYYSGTGLCNFDEDWNELPIHMEPAEEVLNVAALPETPDGAQWFFEWEDMGGAPACLDFGVTTPGYFSICYDMATVYGEENIPAEMVGMYMQYIAWEYKIVPTDATAGDVVVTSYDHFGEKQEAVVGSYSYHDGTMLLFNAEMLYMQDVVMSVGQTVPVYIEQAGGMGM